MQPPTAPRAAAPATAPAAQGSINPFRMAAADAARAPTEDELGIGPDLAETSLDLVLHGTWTTKEGGAAFIRTPDDKQGRYAIGETITPGVTLENVYRDQVVINRGGLRESLRLINREQTAVPREAKVLRDNKIASDVSGTTQIGNFVTVQPQLDEDGNVRLILQPAGDASRFEAIGLRAGDALIGVDNQPFGHDMAENLSTFADLTGRQAVSIVIERDGVVIPITVALTDATGDDE